jgi:hypothetical protein
MTGAAGQVSATLGGAGEHPVTIRPTPSSVPMRSLMSQVYSQRTLRGGSVFGLAGVALKISEELPHPGKGSGGAKFETMVSRIYLLSGCLVLLGFGLMAYFLILGSYVDESGYLVEEFWAWGLGVACVGLGMIWAIVTKVTSSISKRLRK